MSSPRDDMRDPVNVSSRLRPSRRALLGWGSLAGAGLALSQPGAASATQPGPASGTVPKGGGTQPPAAGPGLTPFPQQDDLNFETLFNYGESAYGAGAIGEVASTVALVQSDMAKAGANAVPAYQPYFDRFVALADRVAAQARENAAAGRRVTARGEYLRAAGYYNSALFFVLGTSSPGRESQLYTTMQAQWAAAAALLEPRFERVEIPARVRFPRTPGSSETVIRELRLPAYFAAAPGAGRKPTIIVSNGSDAQFVDIYAYGGASALERGYNVLLFEGPGQGSLLFQQNVPFTPYWQDVVSPLVDYVLARPDVDPGRIGLTGWSFGGLLVLRAAAYEPRIAAVVSDPAFTDNAAPWQQLVSGLKAYGGITDAALTAMLADAKPHGYPFSRPALEFLLRKRGEIYLPSLRQQALRGAPLTGVADLLTAIGSYNAGDELLGRIRSHLLLNSYELDTFFASGQAAAVRASAVRAASITQHLFTEADGAEYHCAPLAPQTRNAVVFDWFDGIFSGPAAPAGRTTGTPLAVPLGIVGAAAAVVGGAVAVDAAHRRGRPEQQPAETGRPAGPELPGPRQVAEAEERSTTDA